MSHCFIRFEEEMGRIVAIKKALGPKVYDDRVPSWLTESALEVVFGEPNPLEVGAFCPREHLREGLKVHEGLLLDLREECADIRAYLGLTHFSTEEEVQQEISWRVMGYEEGYEEYGYEDY